MGGDHRRDHFHRRHRFLQRFRARSPNPWALAAPARHVPARWARWPADGSAATRRRTVAVRLPGWTWRSRWPDGADGPDGTNGADGTGWDGSHGTRWHPEPAVFVDYLADPSAASLTAPAAPERAPEAFAGKQCARLQHAVGLLDALAGIGSPGDLADRRSRYLQDLAKHDRLQHTYS